MKKLNYDWTGWGDALCLFSECSIELFDYESVIVLIDFFDCGISLPQL